MYNVLTKFICFRTVESYHIDVVPTYVHQKLINALTKTKQYKYDNTFYNMTMM